MVFLSSFLENLLFFLPFSQNMCCSFIFSLVTTRTETRTPKDATFVPSLLKIYLKHTEKKVKHHITHSINGFELELQMSGADTICVIST